MSHLTTINNQPQKHIEIRASKGKLLVVSKMPTNEHQEKPPEPTSCPCHGHAHERKKNTGNRQKRQVPRDLTLLFRKGQCLRFKSVYKRKRKKPPERASYPRTWLCCYLTILPALLKCFLSWTQIAHIGSDLHSCTNR